MPADHEMRAECEKRLSELEKDMCVLNKPEQGVLAQMDRRFTAGLSAIHDKVNNGFAARPRWTIFMSIIALLVSFIAGSYAYTAKVTSGLNDSHENYVRYRDFDDLRKELKEMKKELLTEIRRHDSGRPD